MRVAFKVIVMVNMVEQMCLEVLRYQKQQRTSVLYTFYSVTFRILNFICFMSIMVNHHNPGVRFTVTNL